MNAQGLPEVLILTDPETPENAGFRFGMFGKLTAPGGFECYVVQRSPVGEHPNVGFGDWRVHACQHPEHGLCYQLEDKNGRTAILIHSANWFQELLGCLALGRSIDEVVDEKGKWLGKPGAKQMGVTSSADTVRAFFNHMGGVDFMLTIKPKEA
jgi:hypothetical protein